MIRYYVTDRRQADVLSCAERAVRNGVEMVQVREKDLATRELLDLVCKVRNIAAGSATRVLVNDRLDLALAAEIDGVHLPADSLPPARVRRFVRQLGVSVHTIEEAIAAEKGGANFVVFGPVFDSPGKRAVGLEPLRKVVSSVQIPVLAIGGVTAANSSEILAAGAAGIAGIRLFQTD